MCISNCSVVFLTKTHKINAHFYYSFCALLFLIIFLLSSRSLLNGQTVTSNVQRNKQTCLDETKRFSVIL